MFDITSRTIDLLGVGLTLAGSADLTAETGFDSAGTRKAYGTADLVSGSTLAAEGVIIRYGLSGMSSDSRLSGVPLRIKYAIATVVSDSAVTVSAAPVRIRYGISALVGGLTGASGTAYMVVYGEAALDGGGASMSGTPLPVKRLVLATAKRAITEDWLFKRYPIDVGLSLLVTGGTVTEVEVPSQTELAEADYYFLGGRNNPVTKDQIDVLTAAGYGDYIVED